MRPTGTSAPRLVLSQPRSPIPAHTLMESERRHIPARTSIADRTRRLGRKVDLLEGVCSRTVRPLGMAMDAAFARSRKRAHEQSVSRDDIVSQTIMQVSVVLLVRDMR